MLRALAVSLFLAAPSILCLAQTRASNNTTNIEIINKQPSPQSDSAAGSSSGEDSAAEDELLAMANQSRDLAGVSPLRMEAGLREAARVHAARMVASGQLEHQFSGELPLLERIAQAGSLKDAPKIDRAGENIANANGASRANDVLMHSPPHRQNLLDPSFNVAGIAAIWNKGRLYVVQDFAHELPSYSAQESGRLVSGAVNEVREEAGMPKLQQVMPPNLDEATCSLAQEDHLNAHLLATAYQNRKIIAYTQGHPEVLPQGARRLLQDPGVRQFGVGSCYARNAAYPTGTYWIAILLY